MIYQKLLDDTFRNQCIEKIASQITDENIPYDDPSSDIMEYLQKFAISLVVDISNTEEV